MVRLIKELASEVFVYILTLVSSSWKWGCREVTEKEGPGHTIQNEGCTATAPMFVEVDTSN